MAAVAVQREAVPRGLQAPLIELAGVEKVYRTGRVEYWALRGVDLTIASGDKVAIAGPSGSGKSTIIMLAPLRPAVRFKPGEALRHA